MRYIEALRIYHNVIRMPHLQRGSSMHFTFNVKKAKLWLRLGLTVSILWVEGARDRWMHVVLGDRLGQGLQWCQCKKLDGGLVLLFD